MAEFTAVGWEWRAIPGSVGGSIEIGTFTENQSSTTDFLYLRAATQPAWTDRAIATLQRKDKRDIVNCAAGQSLWVISGSQNNVYLTYDIIGGGAAATVDTIAKSDTAQAGESVPVNHSIWADGRTWLNNTGASIVVPATINAATMATAGFVDVTGTPEDWANPITAASHAAMVGLPQLTKPYLRVFRSDANEWLTQTAQPPSNIANWRVVDGQFWGSGAGGTGKPDGNADKTEAIRRDGSVGIGVDALSTLDINGSFATRMLIVSAAGTTVLTAAHNAVEVLNSAATATLQLPAAASAPGREYSLGLAAGNTVSVVTVTSAGGTVETPNGSSGASVTLSQAASLRKATWKSDATNWQLVAAVAANSGADFWRSGAGGVSMPDSTNDTTEAIRRDGDVGLGADPAARLDINGALIKRPISIPNLAANGPIGTAAATVDVGSLFLLNQNTAGITFSFPNPTNAQAGREAWVYNGGTTPAIGPGGIVVEVGTTAGPWEWLNTAWRNPSTDPALMRTGATNAMVRNEELRRFIIGGVGVTLRSVSATTRAIGPLTTEAEKVTEWNTTLWSYYNQEREPPFSSIANLAVPAGYEVSENGIRYRRNTTGIAGANLGADLANWTSQSVSALTQFTVLQTETVIATNPNTFNPNSAGHTTVNSVLTMPAATVRYSMFDGGFANPISLPSAVGRTGYLAYDHSASFNAILNITNSDLTSPVTMQTGRRIYFEAVNGLWRWRPTPGAPLLLATVMTGATAGAAGTSGDVPAPAAGENTRPLLGSARYTPAATEAINVTTGTTGILTLDSGTTGAINIGASANAKPITIGNTTAGTTLTYNAGTGGHQFNTVPIKFGTTSAVERVNVDAGLKFYGGALTAWPSAGQAGIDGSGGTLRLAGASGGLLIYGSGNQAMAWDSAGKVTISQQLQVGPTAPGSIGVRFSRTDVANISGAYTYINGTTQSTNGGPTGSVTWCAEFDSRVRFGAEVNFFSDRRAKNHIEDIDGAAALDKVMSLRAVRYTWKTDLGFGADSMPKLGWYAQEVGDAGIGEAVTVTDLGPDDPRSKTTPDYHAIDKDQLLAVLWAAVREQQKQIDDLKGKIIS